MAFDPVFTLTAETAKALMAIEASRAAIDRLPISPQLIASLRESARLLSTHYSTQIEGNRLSFQSGASDQLKRAISENSTSL
ncbi:MAG: hypothetical protein KDN18_01430 [Verrucomicrobiae bacterium]|nr:hypothetical protein [Verrucomicrobiae bacterium]